MDLERAARRFVRAHRRRYDRCLELRELAAKVRLSEFAKKGVTYENRADRSVSWLKPRHTVIWRGRNSPSGKIVSKSMLINVDIDIGDDDFILQVRQAFEDTVKKAMMSE